MHVAELWRFPVKSMAGELLGQADVRPDGIVGDRVADVIGAHGRIVTARTRPRLLGHRATLGMDGEPQGGGRGAAAPHAGGVGGGGGGVFLGGPPGEQRGGGVGGLYLLGGGGGAPRGGGVGGGTPRLFREAETRSAENVELRRPAGLEVD